MQLKASNKPEVVRKDGPPRIRAEEDLPALRTRLAYRKTFGIGNVHLVLLLAGSVALMRLEEDRLSAQLLELFFRNFACQILNQALLRARAEIR